MGQRSSADRLDLSALAPELSQSLLAWWEVHGRKAPDLKPWMFTKDGRWPEPHEHLNVLECWIAEVMLQQTQLLVALPYWRRWMQAFPSLEALAAADEHDVLLLWQGLGYYARGRRLLTAARLLHDQSSPASSQQAVAWPRTLEAWLGVPGIGPSTAGGILSSAFNSPAAILDGNVRRVLARVAAYPHPPAAEQRLFWSWSEALLAAAPKRYRDLNQALMDLGATLCTPRNPACGRCPWQPHCAAHAVGAPEGFPVKAPPRSVPHLSLGVGITRNAAGDVLIVQRTSSGLLAGLWEFPSGEQLPEESIASTIGRYLSIHIGIEVEVEAPLLAFDHAYSHRKLHIQVYLCRWRHGAPDAQARWVAPADLARYPLSAAHARIAAALQQHLAEQESL
jgi:A/G-specific adenine glycosylase